jgi:hypothetical protein
MLITVNFYRYNTKHENDELLESIEKNILHWLSKFPNLLLLIGGDSNITIDNSTDRWPPGRSTNQNLGLILLMEKFDLMERCFRPTDHSLGVTKQVPDNPE